MSIVENRIANTVDPDEMAHYQNLNFLNRYLNSLVCMAPALRRDLEPVRPFLFSDFEQRYVNKSM